jgi:hypothetical protein
MTPANGHANGGAVSQPSQTTGPVAAAEVLDVPATPPLASQKIQELFKELAVPFDPSVIEWRVTNTAKGEQRGQVVPYADPRAYTDRLNEMFTPAGWTRKYAVHTSANFERAKDKKIVAKVLITCELTVFGVGSHSATGEEFADNENALTAAEAQAFKRSCACFGLGRYLYYFKGVWVDLDERKRPTSVPRLFDWATPQGWREGRRPHSGDSSSPASALDDLNSRKLDSLIHEIEEMAGAIGKRLYRGVLKAVARVWNPIEIHDPVILQTVLNEMRAADGELRRLDAALNQVEPGTLIPILRSLRLDAVEHVDSLENLRKIVHEVERAAGILDV